MIFIFYFISSKHPWEMGIIIFLREVYWLVQVGELTGGRPGIYRMDSWSGAQRGLVADQHLVRGSNWAKTKRQEIPGPLEKQQMVFFAEERLGWRQIKLDRQRRPWRTEVSFREALEGFDKNSQRRALRDINVAVWRRFGERGESWGSTVRLIPHSPAKE